MEQYTFGEKEIMENTLRLTEYSIIGLILNLQNKKFNTS